MGFVLDGKTIPVRFPVVTPRFRDATEIIPAAELEEQTLALARRIAEAPPFAARMLKRSVNRTLEIQGLRGALQAHFDTHELTHTSRESWELVNGGGEAGMLAKGKTQGSTG